MAWFAEVSVAPAEPLGDRAAEFALELDEISSVLGAAASTYSKLLRGALAAYQVLRLEVLLLLLRRDTIFHAAEVGYFALEALVVCKFE